MSFGYYGGKNAMSGLRHASKAGRETHLVTTELLGAMIGWMSGDRNRASAVVQGGFEQMMSSVEHIDCYPEICILEKYEVLQKFVPGSHAALATSVHARCGWVG